ncbi:MAG: SMP-30/gluconolactonase/LRE family protein [Symploca sp. SIO2D2]|nr:SMP-30/gluconolactonase/LRE family protein [Symploca sp. SIO2D2]
MQDFESLSVFCENEDELGECPLWHAKSDSLYWIDWCRNILYRKKREGSSAEHIQLDRNIRAFAFCRSGDLLLNLNGGLSLLNWENGELHEVISLSLGEEEQNVNDAKCDARGRFWFGTISSSGKGRLLRFDPADKSLRTIREDIHTSNGIGWSADGEAFYYADSGKKIIWKCAYDLETGELGPFEDFADFSSIDLGNPDGLAVDVEGCVWVAMWDGKCVLRISETGKILRCIDFPVMRPTSCAFGGEDLKTLYVTSAAVDLEPQPAEQVLRSGNVFSMKVSIPGVPVAECAI